MTFIKKILIGIAALAGVLSLGSIAYADRVAPQANSLGGGSFNFVSNVGIGSTTPFALLSVGGLSNANSFAISGPSNQYVLTVDNSGFLSLGCGTTNGYEITICPSVIAGGNADFLMNNGGNKFQINVGAATHAITTDSSLSVTASNGNIWFLPSTGFIGIGTSTPISNLQVTAPAANATTLIQLGKPNQNKGTCVTEYDTAGTPLYHFIAAGATSYTFTSTKPSGCQN